MTRFRDSFRSKSFRFKSRGSGEWLKKIPLIGDKLDDMSKIFSFNEYTKQMRDRLKSIGSKSVTSMIVARKPINGMLEKVISLAAGGEWEKAKANIGADKYFHLFSIITVDGEKYKLEKNQNIKLVPYDGETTDDSIIINVTFPISLESMLEKTKIGMGKERYFRYDGIKSNCQDFLLGFLSQNNLLTSDSESFIKQDTSYLEKVVPNWKKNAINSVTDAGHMFGMGELQEWENQKEIKPYEGAIKEEKMPDPDRPISGGLINIRDGEKIDIAKRALRMLNDSLSGGNKFRFSSDNIMDSIPRAKQQVVAGMLYKLGLLLKDSNNKVELHNIQLYHKLNGEWEFHNL